MIRKPSPAMLVALLALFCALGGIGVAADGQGLILGKPDNVATSKTGLNASFNDKALVVTNTSSGSNATALGLNVASGKPPITVSAGAGKATNLNADKVDGIDSAGFVRGKGAVYRNRVLVTGSTDTTVLAIPTYATVKVLNCRLTVPDASASIINPENVTTTDVWRDRGGSGDPGYIRVNGGWGWTTPLEQSAHSTFQIARGTGASAQHATVDVWTVATTSQCIFAATAVVYG
jgi:hypothetical protein